MHHLFLIRHGTTEAIEKHLMQGSTDSLLSANGREEARRVAEALKAVRFDAVFSSPMGRSVETARIITHSHHGLEIIQLDDLREMNFGFYEYKPYFGSPDEVPQGFRRLNLLVKILIAQATGESLSRVRRRAFKSWEQITTTTPGGVVLIVSHGVLLNCLLQYLLPEDSFEAIKPASLRPCSITELEVYSPGKAKILRINGTAHLK